MSVIVISVSGSEKEAVEFVKGFVSQNVDVKNKAFMERLIPSVDPSRINGLKTPVLRSFVKSFAKNPLAYAFLNVLPHDSYEENAVHASLIGLLYSKDLDKTYEEIERFLPYVDNWATGDTLAPKCLKKDPERLHKAILKWVESPLTYTVRFAFTSALEFLLDEDYFYPDLLERFASVSSDEYYINIASAWYYSFALIKQYDATIGYLEQNRLPKWIHNKTIQKAVESFRISDERKAYLKTLRRK